MATEVTVASLRLRARSVLCQADADGRLEKALGNWAANEDGEVVKEITAAEFAALSAEDQAEVTVETTVTTVVKKKKKDRGRGLAAALALADQQTDPDFVPSAEQKAQAVHADHRPDLTGVGHAMKTTTGFSRGADRNSQQREVERLAAEKDEERREKFAKKFLEAERQAERREEKQALHQKRLLFIEEKMKTLLEQVVSKVSELPAGRPANPVPLMIEVLMEISGKPASKFSMCSPANRMRRDINELKEEIKELQEMYDNGDRFTDCSDAEDLPLSASHHSSAIETKSKPSKTAAKH